MQIPILLRIILLVNLLNLTISFKTVCHFPVSRYRIPSSRQVMSSQRASSSNDIHSSPISRLVQVYSRPGCSFCVKAKSKLSSLGVPFEEIDVSSELKSSDPLIQSRTEFTLSTTVPQIYVGDELIGGCDRLLEDIESGSFNTRLHRWKVSIQSPVDEPKISQSTSTFDESITTKKPRLDSNQSYFLNDGSNKVDISTLPDPLTLSQSLQRLMLQLKDSVMSDDGKRVNYDVMRESELYKQYQSLSSLLAHYKIEEIKNTMSEAQRFSFFVNIYNAMIIDAVCALGPAENTPAARTAFFSGASGARYNICGLTFSPDDVEHGLLRANTAHPSKQALGEIHYFADDDPRSQLAVSKLDPRLHFILNCGAMSCPPIAVLGNDPDRALQLAAAGYLAAEVSVTVTSESVSETSDATSAVQSSCTLNLPKLLLWYGNDFGADLKQRLDQILSMCSAPHREELEGQLRKFGWPEEIRFEVKYSDYNWTPNSLST